MIGVGRELMGRRKDGSLIPIEAAVSEFRLKDRRFFTGVLRDLTERRRAERALRESEERFRAIADYTFAWENWISADGRVLWISPAVERITGYTVDECHTMRDYPLPLIQPDDRKRLAVLLETAHRERTSGDGERFRVRHKDGTPVWCSISWHPIFSADNEHVGYRSSIRDISARMRAEENARERLAELAHVGRVSLLNEMAAGLSHELSQPLAAIVNYAYACMEQIRSGKSTESGLMAILKCSADEAQRAGEIIEHMLKFGRKRTVRREHVDLNTLVRQAVELVSYEKGSDGVQIECDLEPSLPPVIGDPVEIEQVLINLTRNSVEAVKENGAGTRSVVIQTSEKDDCLVECSIRDTGGGMTESQLKRMFEPFYTTKSNGVGLGLSISRSIVEDHGGRLWAAMNEPQGAILLMTLPTKKGEPSH